MHKIINVDRLWRAVITQKWHVSNSYLALLPVSNINKLVPALVPAGNGFDSKGLIALIGDGTFSS